MQGAMGADRRRMVRLVMTMVALALLAAGCTNDDGDAGERPNGPTTAHDERPWPEPDWDATDPASAGLDEAVLEDLRATAETSRSNCLVVSSDGQIVAEWYWNDTGPESEQEAFSVTKSITSTLVGIEQDDGALDIDQPASDFITEWVGTPSEAVTIRNLLSNDSGRFHTIESDYLQMALREEDKTAFSIGLGQQSEVGTEWIYNNAAVQVLEAVLERATGVEVGEFARSRLFVPLGMTSSIATDPSGNTLTFMGAQMSCRDMARFGLLHLRDGEWNGEQIVSADWIAEATSPSTELNPGYGYLWWLYGDDGGGQIETAPGQGALPGEVHSAYAAIGLGDQVVAVLPDHDMVVTRLGNGEGLFPLPEVLTLIDRAVGQPAP